MANLKQKNEKAVNAGKTSAAAQKERQHELVETWEKHESTPETPERDESEFAENDHKPDKEENEPQKFR